jgi:hypothetical protein
MINQNLKLSENNFFKKFHQTLVQTRFKKNKNRNSSSNNMCTSSLLNNKFLYQISKKSRNSLKKNKKKNSLNNSIDINISLDYKKKNKVKDIKPKYPNQKYSSIDEKRIKNKSLDDINNNLCSIQNNLNISFTNFASPKANNSFYINPIFMHGKNFNDIKKLNAKNDIISSDEKSNRNKQILFLGSNQGKNSENNKLYEIFIKTMNDNILKVQNNEKNNSKINSKIHDIIQQTLNDFANVLQSNEKNVILNILFQFNKLIQYKNEEIKEVKNEYKELENKYMKIQQKNSLIQNENNQLRKKLELILEKINSNCDSESLVEINSNALKTKSFEKSESSLNMEDLESIRFFDKIIMRRNSFSNSKIPTLNFSGQGQNIKKLKSKNYPKYQFFHDKTFNKLFTLNKEK